MAYLNHNIPPFSAYIRNEYLYNHTKGHGDFTFEDEMHLLLWQYLMVQHLSQSNFVLQNFDQINQTMLMQLAKRILSLKEQIHHQQIE